MSTVNLRLILAIFLSASYSLSQVIDNNRIERLCPKPVGGWSMPCGIQCNNDNECPADRKCCRLNSCASYCAEPIYVDQNGVIPKEKLLTSEENSFQNFVNSKVNQAQIIKTAVDEKQETDLKNLPPPLSLFESNSISDTRNEIPNVGCFDECAKNVDCESGYSCAKAGCRNVCKLDSLDLSSPSVSSDLVSPSVSSPSVSVDITPPSTSLDLTPPSVSLDVTSPSVSLDLPSPSVASQMQNMDFRMNSLDFTTPRFIMQREVGVETEQFSNIPTTSADQVVDSLQINDLTKDVCINECFNHFDCRNGFCINIGCHTFCKSSI
ncbi:uncharacterized protein LOC127704384 isoform X2 [Mytilus californianus]|nr:uncharacterized protein LOC127704384 isoform X2 [Mytilus californianus]